MNQQMPYGIQPGQAFNYQDCYGNQATAYAFCSSIVSAQSAQLTVVNSYDTTPTTNQVPQGSMINNLLLTVGNPESPCGLAENNKFFNEANGAGYSDKCSVTVLYCYGVSADMLLNMPQAVAIDNACLTETWDANNRAQIINSMQQHYWNKFPVYTFSQFESPSATSSTPVVNYGARNFSDLGCNCWYTFTRRDETLEIAINNLDSTPFPVGSTIQFTATFATLQLVPSLDCVRPLGSVELTPASAAPATTGS